MEATIKFQVGQTVTARSLCNYDCIYVWKIVSRTSKFITVTDGYETKRVGISIYRGVETAFPQGKYSMAPMVSADEAPIKELAVA